MIVDRVIDKVITIDCEHVFPEYAASYLLIEEGKALFVDNNTQFAVPILLSVLKEQGLRPEDVEYIIITHVHLDHAGGTSALAKSCPNATVLAHERAARHIIDPTKLIESASAVSGEEKFRKTYGLIEHVDKSRVRIVQDNEIIKFGTRELRFIYTSGHAKHHMCIYDSGSNGIFTGDTFGIALPALQAGTKPFIFPSTAPTDFDPHDAKESVKKILETGAEIAFVTHFGPFKSVKLGAEMLIEHILNMESFLKDAQISGLQGEELEFFCFDKMNRYFEQELEKRGLPFSIENKKLLHTDIDFNAKGIAYTSQKLKKEEE